MSEKVNKIKSYGILLSNIISILKLEIREEDNMVWKDIWIFKESIEYEYKFPGKYGAKGEKRSKKKKATPEQIRKQNQQNREKKTRRLIKANFSPGDWWVTLKYPEGTRLPLGEVKKHFKIFLGRMRKAYKKLGVPFKFIYRIEVGRRGGLHMHILLNRIPESDHLVRMYWSEHGWMNFTPLNEAGGYKKLANYIVAQPDEEEWEQLSLFSREEQKVLISYNSSRNLIRPQPERKSYRRRTMRKLLENGPKATPGYYIDADSVHYGVNPFTGFSYYQYTECILDKYGINRKAEWNEDGKHLHRHQHKGTEETGRSVSLCNGGQDGKGNGRCGKNEKNGKYHGKLPGGSSS